MFILSLVIFSLSLPFLIFFLSGKITYFLTYDILFSKVLSSRDLYLMQFPYGKIPLVSPLELIFLSIFFIVSILISYILFKIFKEVEHLFFQSSTLKVLKIIIIVSCVLSMILGPLFSLILFSKSQEDSVGLPCVLDSDPSEPGCQ